MEKNGEIKQKGHLYQMGHNPFRSFYAGIPGGGHALGSEGRDD
jgi:hypothetical protein